MLIQPTSFAERTRQSVSSADARNRALLLYRHWQKAAPEITSIYMLDLPLALVRSKIRQQFELKRNVTDSATIDVLLMKGHAEFQETINYWKQKCHVMKYFTSEEDPDMITHMVKNKKQGEEIDFMQEFIEGKPGPLKFD